MKFLGNILWLLFGGIVIAIIYYLAFLYYQRGLPSRYCPRHRCDIRRGRGIRYCFPAALLPEALYQAQF